MSSIRAASVEPRKMKKGMEKSVSSANRDYLDMDTDEEEFGKQETPEPDEELPPEPEKPVFTDDELETLVQSVKDLTILPYNQEYNWLPDTIILIQEYFCSPANTILTIHSEGTDCKATLGFPLKSEQGLTYFLRSPWQVYTPDNFMSTVIFGNLSGDLENSILNFLESLYAPIAIQSNEWPKATKDEVFSNLNQFLIKLTDATYGLMGLTILYVPREGVQHHELTSSLCHSENDHPGFIERLERVARYWIKQIRGALRGTNLPPRSTYRTIIEEIEFWNYRFENLSCLHHQLNSKAVLSIVETLEEVNSSSVKQFHSLSSEVDKLAEEAASNITYLNLFVNYCGDFKVPSGIEDYSSKILYLIRFVGLESKFYNSQDKIETLCRSLGTQIIEQCKKYINLETILEGDASEGRKMLENSINCCKQFLKIYDRISQMDLQSEHSIISRIMKKSTFCHVDTFIQRCQDLIEISYTRIVYDTCKEVKIIGGPRGVEHELEYQKIEKSFTEILEGIKGIRDCILDVTNYIWLNRIMEFSKKIRDVDNMVKNLIQEIFKDVQNIEEGIEALYAMKRFIQRKNLQETIANYWMIVWKIFEREIELINIEKEYSLDDVSRMPNVGVATILRIRVGFLKGQFNMLIDASDWLGDSNVQRKIIEKYKRIQCAIAEKEDFHFSNWEKNVQSDSEILDILKQPVLRFLPPPNQNFLTVNIDVSYLQNMREVIEWRYLKYDSKVINSKFLQKWYPIKLRCVKIGYLSELYNGIIKQLTDSERLLLENAINDTRNAIIPVLPRCTWAVENIERLYAEWLKNILLLKDVVTIFKTNDLAINSACKKIEKIHLIKGTTNIYYTLDEFKNYLNSVRSESLSLLKELSNSISSSLYILHRKAKYGETTPRHWIVYVNGIVESFKRSLIENIRASLISASKFFHVDCLNDREPLLLINLSLSQDKSIEFAPDISEIDVALKDVIGMTVGEIHSTDEFIRLFKFGDNFKENENFIHADDSVNKLINRLQEVIVSGLNDLHAFENSVKKVEHISNVYEILNTLGQENIENPREILETSIRWCEKILEISNSLDTAVRINFMMVNTEQFKIQTSTDCENLKDMLFVELSKFIASELAIERMPIHNDNI